MAKGEKKKRTPPRIVVEPKKIKFDPEIVIPLLIQAHLDTVMELTGKDLAVVKAEFVDRIFTLSKERYPGLRSDEEYQKVREEFHRALFGTD